MAGVSYEYRPNVPLPFATDEQDRVREEWGWGEGPLCRNQKILLFMERAQFDAAGQFTGWGGGGSTYLSGPSTCAYDVEGRLSSLVEAPSATEAAQGEFGDRPGEIVFSYREDGTLCNVKYGRPHMDYGTADFSGEIQYDEQGRMIYNHYYRTHGSHANIFLYEGDAPMPWACIYWCPDSCMKVNLYVPD